MGLVVIVQTVLDLQTNNVVGFYFILDKIREPSDLVQKGTKVESVMCVHLVAMVTMHDSSKAESKGNRKTGSHFELF